MKRITETIIALMMSGALAADLPDMMCVEAMDSWTKVENKTLQPTYFDNPDRFRIRDGWKIKDGKLYEVMAGQKKEIGPIRLSSRDHRVYVTYNRLIQFDDDTFNEGLTVGVFIGTTEFMRIRCLPDLSDA